MSNNHHFSRLHIYVPLWAFLLFANPSELAAQSQPPSDMRIADVRFSRDRPRIGGTSWFAMEVRVDVRNNSDPTAPNRQFLDDVRVYAAMAHNLGTQSKPQLEYFWTEVEAPTLERGTHTFRFYLSPEQIKRGQISSGQPYAWFVQVSYGRSAASGEPSTPTAFAVSDLLRGPGRLERFQELLDSQKTDRAGILLPQIETPFRDMYISETPTLRGKTGGNE